MKYSADSHGVDWTLRSLLAAAFLSMCVMVSAYSATISAHRAEKAERADRALAQEAELVADLANYLTKETEATRNALTAPRLKPARATTQSLVQNTSDAIGVDFDFTALTVAKLDAEERNCLAQAIYYEARSEPRVGQLAVADVIFNRVKSAVYPNSICEVVFQGSERHTGCQFSFTCDGSMQARLNKRKWDQSEQLAGAILAGVHVPVSRNATHYHANYVDPYWAPNLTPTATIGVHKFYKFKSNRTVAAAPATM